MRWKWLFIYPQENIATVNFIQIPINTPIDFELTAGDAPMNSFWIPSLGGQMYAMETMETQLHLIGNSIGDFPGGAAEINGSGFAGMRFTAKVSSNNDFNNWVQSVKKSSNPLNTASYNQLSIPSEYNQRGFYSSVQNGIFNDIMMKYMSPGSQKMHMPKM